MREFKVDIYVCVRTNHLKKIIIKEKAGIGTTSMILHGVQSFHDALCTFFKIIEIKKYPLNKKCTSQIGMTKIILFLKKNQDLPPYVQNKWPLSTKCQEALSLHKIDGQR